MSTFILNESEQVAVGRKHAVMDRFRNSLGRFRPTHRELIESIRGSSQPTQYKYAVRMLRADDDALKKPEPPVQDRVEVRKNRKIRFDQLFSSPNRNRFVKKGEGIGVELEFYCPAGNHSLLRELAGNRNSESSIGGLRLKYDSSVSADIDISDFREAVLFLKYGQYSRLYKTCHKLRELGAEVNASCGLHVHIDCRDCRSTPAAMTRAARLRAALPWLKRMVPQSRNNGRYSSATRGRYQPINSEAWGVHNTIEVRLHSGTLNPDKVKNWIELVRFIALRNGRGSRPTYIETLDNLLSSDAPDYLKHWVVSRTNTFNPVLGNEAEDSESVPLPTPEAAQIAAASLPPLGRVSSEGQRDESSVTFVTR
mgnify:CR=1 FL=1|tara:strand:+ start:4856 stop:5959 length:1104 start_codon:yes stop_codon:yes gene_type:complete